MLRENGGRKEYAQRRKKEWKEHRGEWSLPFYMGKSQVLSNFVFPGFLGGPICLYFGCGFLVLPASASDGDCNHLDEAVPLPGAIELAADAATVGRVPEKADIVIPIATVSGLHARLERKGATLFVTDLDSTNGTYINDRQIRPGAVTPVPPGSRVTFVPNLKTQNLEMKT
ncbi:hypothetical protein GOP47_0020950 [Adiantum capillus-veneris]|uniref:FHA domain-containing protein n=1 Tax=Adiantum capillus-veneris TaxID=13818 RepID=A0A9D4UAD9_ADICA|nr:hypothetical protein GOP47_0020950 [Adiantum capillus-veneris]